MSKALCPSELHKTAHYVSAEELRANKGVCTKCLKEYHRRRENNDGDIPKESVYESSVGYVDGHAESFVDFDYDACDRGNPLVSELTEASEESKAKYAVEGFKKIVEWVLRDKNRLRTVTNASTRFEAMVALLYPETMDNLSYEQIGRRHGITKAAVCKAAMEFSDMQFSKHSESRKAIHFRRSRLEKSRLTFSKKTKETHEKRKRIDANKPSTGNHITRLMARNK